MKCFKCGRALQSGTKHFYLDGKPIGPTCYAALGQKPQNKITNKVIVNDQPDLFGEKNDK